MSENIENEKQKDYEEQVELETQEEHETQTQHEVSGDSGTKEGLRETSGSEELEKTEIDELKDIEVDDIEALDSAESLEPIPLEDSEIVEEEAEEAVPQADAGTNEVVRPNALFILLANSFSSEVVALEGVSETDNAKASKATINVIQRLIGDSIDIMQEEYDTVEQQLVNLFDEFIKSDDMIHQVDIGLGDTSGQSHIANMAIQKTLIS